MVLTIGAEVTSIIGAEATTGEVFHGVVSIRDTILKDILNLMEVTVNPMEPFPNPLRILPNPHQIFSNPALISQPITQIAQFAKSA